MDLEVAREVARRGGNLVLVARSWETLERLTDELRDRHAVCATALVADLSTADGVQELQASLADLDVQVDVLINNAGAGTVGPFLDSPLERHRRSIELNIGALTTLTHGLGQHMAARGSGAIINIASTAAFQPSPYQAATPRPRPTCCR